MIMIEFLDLYSDVNVTIHVFVCSYLVALISSLKCCFLISSVAIISMVNKTFLGEIP